MRHALLLRYFETVARTGSIRAAAEQLAITSTALNRRILSLEKDLGVELFERHAQGVRLNSAGELFIQHARGQLTDLERVRSRIADLSGMRRGHVRLAATRDLARRFLPIEMRSYRARFPGVSFDLRSLPRADAEQAVLSQQSDLACVVEPLRVGEFQVLAHVPQPLHAVMPLSNPLLKRDALRLHELLEHPLLLPPRGDGVRELIQQCAKRRQLTLTPAVESDDPAVLESMSALGAGVCLSIAAELGPHLAHQGLGHAPVDPRDLRPASLLIGQVRQRGLPVATARFAEELCAHLDHAGAT